MSTFPIIFFCQLRTLKANQYGKKGSIAYLVSPHWTSLLLSITQHFCLYLIWTWTNRTLSSREFLLYILLYWVTITLEFLLLRKRWWHAELGNWQFLRQLLNTIGLQFPFLNISTFPGPLKKSLVQFLYFYQSIFVILSTDYIVNFLIIFHISGF